MFFKKKYGQHFLKIIPKSLKKIINTFTLNNQSALIIIETGPGGGILTHFILDNLKNRLQASSLDNNLTNKGREVPSVFYRAIEIDTDLKLEWDYQRFIDFKLIYGDILKISINKLIQDIIINYDLLNLNKINIFLFGALPYNISKKIVLKQAHEFCLLTTINRFYKYHKMDYRQPEKDFVDVNNKFVGYFWYMLQKEVADSFLAVYPNATFIGNCLRLYVKSLHLGDVLSSYKFYPKPQVESASIYGEFDLVYSNRFSAGQNCDFRTGICKCMRKVFFYNRKTIRKILKVLHVSNQILQDFSKSYRDILKKRPQELTLKDWKELCSVLQYQKL